jgi:hypothetical protein
MLLISLSKQTPCDIIWLKPLAECATSIRPWYIVEIELDDVCIEGKTE